VVEVDADVCWEQDQWRRAVPAASTGPGCPQPRSEAAALISIHDLIHELLNTHTGYTRLRASGTASNPANRVCGYEHSDYGSDVHGVAEIRCSEIKCAASGGSRLRRPGSARALLPPVRAVGGSSATGGQRDGDCPVRTTQRYAEVGVVEGPISSDR
jgi:hypothetical protein